MPRAEKRPRLEQAASPFHPRAFLLQEAFLITSHTLNGCVTSCLHRETGCTMLIFTC